MTAENQNEESSNEGADERNLSIQGSADDSTIVVGDRNTFNQGPSYYTTNVFSSFDVNQFPARPPQQLSQQEYRWRQVLVQNVKHYWIEGVLERSLHNQALIELGLEERAQAVASPISAAEEFVEDTGRPFPAGTQATDVFDGLGPGRTLLILGEPGAGKTTTLLKLTKTLIARIGDDLSQPIPVVLNLSSWAKERKPIAEWLVQDLYETFQVSKALGTTWIKGEQLTLCLDGLDEVAAEYRNACLKALNQFLQSHGRTEVVVCSRIRDYESLAIQLRVRCAIYVQPLTPRQIDQYVEQAGEKLSALSTVLFRNPEIKTFAASPLILSVMSLAYQGYSLEDFPELDSLQVFRQRLFETYTERMLLHRGESQNFTSQQAKYWLAWMAKRMVATSQTVFFIENIQPSWFQRRMQRLCYRFESSLSFGLVFGVISGLIIGLGENFNEGIFFGSFFGLSSGLIAITLGEIKPLETLKWSWQEANKSLYSGLISGLIIGLIFYTLFVLTVELRVRLVGGLIAGVGSGLIGGLLGGLIGGLRGAGMNNKIKPNQGIWESSRNAGMFTVIVGLISGLSIVLVILIRDGWQTGLEAGLTDELTMGLILGIIAGLVTGGSACIRHFLLRLKFYRMGYIPWNYARFLDYASEHLFLKQVGGGYIFVHRMLLEYFAQITLE